MTYYALIPWGLVLAAYIMACLMARE